MIAAIGGVTVLAGAMSWSIGVLRRFMETSQATVPNRVIMYLCMVVPLGVGVGIWQVSCNSALWKIMLGWKAEIQAEDIPRKKN